MAESAEAQKIPQNPLFSEAEMKRIKDSAPRSWNRKTAKELQNAMFWEAVDAAYILKSRGGYDENDMLIYTKKDEKGRVQEVLLVNGKQVVYPVFIEKPDSKVLGVEFDLDLSTSLRQHASRVASPRQSSLQSQPTR